MDQGSRPVEIFFAASRCFFAGQISSPAVREFGRPAKKQARHPGRWPRLDSAPSRLFFRGPRNFKPGGLEIWPAAGRSGSAYKGFPIGEPPAGLSAAKKNKLGPRAAWPCEKTILTGQPTTGPAKKKQARLLPAGRSSTQPLSRFFFREKSCSPEIRHRPWIPAGQVPNPTSSSTPPLGDRMRPPPRHKPRHEPREQPPA